jgi:Flagellar biosynthesis/type III secretory pathway ATPase
MTERERAQNQLLIVDHWSEVAALERLHARLHACTPTRLHAVYGRLVQASGLVLESICPTAFIGELALVECEPEPLLAEVVGFRNGTTLLMPLGDLTG